MCREKLPVCCIKKTESVAEADLNSVFTYIAIKKAIKITICVS